MIKLQKNLGFTEGLDSHDTDEKLCIFYTIIFYVAQVESFT